jgi:hypothetical protein
MNDQNSKSGVPIGLIVLAIVIAAAALFYPQYSLNHDASWYLISTQMFLDGGALYSDIFEINPPLAFYITIPPVALAGLLGSNPATAYFLYCIAIGLSSALWCRKVLSKSDFGAGQKVGLFMAVLIILFVLPISEFGQREHLMLLFAMPFFLAQIFRERAPGIGIMHHALLGAIGAVGLLLKPYFLVIPAGIAVMRLAQERDLKIFYDPGMLALAAMSFAYLGFIAIAHPAYLAEVVPIATAVYANYGMGAEAVLMRGELAALALIALAGWYYRAIWECSFGLLAAGVVAAAASYLLQFKGWNYQVLPLSAFLFLTAAVLFLRKPDIARKNVVAMAALVLVALVTVGVQIARGPYQSRSTDAFGQFVTSEGQSIMVLSTNVSAAFPFVNEVSGRWASRYPAQWLVPGAHDALTFGECGSKEDCAKAREILNFARGSIIEDIERYQPSLIYVDARAQKAYFRDPDFDYLEFLADDPRFAAIEACFEKAGEALGFSVLRNTCETGVAE